MKTLYNHLLQIPFYNATIKPLLLPYRKKIFTAKLQRSLNQPYAFAMVNLCFSHSSNMALDIQVVMPENE